MSEATELIAQQLGSAISNQRTWGTIIINVKDPQYNAKGNYDPVTGQGADDTAAIQLALAAANGNGWIVFPPGKYRISAQLNINTHFDAKQATFYTTGVLDSSSSIIPGVFNITAGKSVWLPSLVKASVTTPAYNYGLTQLTITVPQISKNGGLIDQTYLTDSLKQMIAGTAPINAVPADESITPDKTTFIKSVVNIFDPIDVSLGIVSSANGTIIANSSWYASGYIPVVNGKTYKATPMADYAFYNSSKVFVSGVTHTWAVETITPPVGATFVRITIQVIDLNTTMVVKDKLPIEYLPHTTYSVEISDQKFQIAITKSINTTSKWANKTWNVVGDSLTEHNARTTKNYQDYIANRIGCTVNNYGLSGTGWRTPSVSAGTDAFYQRMGSFATNADLITVFGGTNDWAGVGIAFNMGTFGDTDPAASFYGALDYTIKGLINKYPTKTIAVFTPIPRGPNPWALNSGVTLEQVADAIIKVSTHYSVPVLDLYRVANVYAWNTNYNTFALPDGLHPNDNGHMALADKILAFLNTL